MKWLKNWKANLKKLVQFLLNPRFLICFFLGWMVTNGWSYVLFAIGTLTENAWMLGISSAYLAFLWLPISPEKLVTITIAIALLRWLFPNDQKTLAVLKDLYAKAKAAVKRKKTKDEEKS